MPVASGNAHPARSRENERRTGRGTGGGVARALVLSGGNALGAYAAGAYEALHARGHVFDVVSGASIGAVNAAIIAGNAFEHRVAKLREFWAQAALGTTAALVPTRRATRELYNGASVLQTLFAGRVGLFVPHVPGLLSALPGMPPDVSIFDHRLGAATLRRVVDFDRLNAHSPPLIVSAVDAQTGEVVRFDTRLQPIAPVHLLASTAMPPLFPPVEVDGRLFVDPGLVENLPLDPVLEAPLAQDLLCIAVDLYAPNGEPLRDLDSVIERAQDILFSAQSRRTLEHHVERHRLRRIVASLRGSAAADAATRNDRDANRDATHAELTVVRIAYRASPQELASKGLDFSQASLEERWSAGRDDMHRALDRLDAGQFTNRSDGCTLYDCA